MVAPFFADNTTHASNSNRAQVNAPKVTLTAAEALEVDLFAGGFMAGNDAAVGIAVAFGDLSQTGVIGSGVADRAHPGDRCVHDSSGLLRNQGVAGIANERDAHPLAEFDSHLAAPLRRLEGIVLGLQIEQRHVAARPIGVLRNGRARRTLHRLHVRVPPLQPAAGIIAGREEGQAKRCEPNRLG